MTQLTSHFSLEELTSSNKAKALKIDNTPPKDIVENLKALALALELIRSVLGKPMKISSAYRCPALNAAVKGSKTSAHTLGFAADFTVDGMTPRQICEKIMFAGLSFQQMICEDVSKEYPDGRWVHFAIDKTSPMKREYLEMSNGKYYKGKKT